jgi:RNA-directed DNA polymerase
LTSLSKNEPAEVPATAKQAGEIRDRWSWVERAAWTERMLAALETGPKGGKWYSLIDKVSSRRVLEAALQSVVRNRGSAGVDHVSVETFSKRAEEELSRLSAELRSGTYHPQAVLRTWIPKPGSKEQRPLGIPSVRDRVVQKACVLVLEPIFEAEFAPTSYGFRPGRCARDALERVNAQLESGHTWVVDADIKGYFDSIPHDRLMELVGTRVADGSMLVLLTQFLKAAVQEGGIETRPVTGTPQGGVVSPLLANIYLNELDHRMVEEGFEMTRYADDLVILCREEAEARRALSLLEQWMVSRGLTLHGEKSRVVDMQQPGAHFDFLGYRFQRSMKDPLRIHRLVRPKSLKSFQDRIRRYTRRSNGEATEGIVAGVNRLLRGWFNYFELVAGQVLRQLDSWIRARLRTLLRRRHKRRGRAGRTDNIRWPNSLFKKLGLFSLFEAQAESSRPSLR